MVGFVVDERKLRRALEAQPTPRTLDDDLRDLAMVGQIIAGPLLLAASLALLLGALLSFL